MRLQHELKETIMHFYLCMTIILHHFRKINTRKCHQNKDISKYRAKATENMQEVKWENKVRLKEWISIVLQDCGGQVTQKTQELEGMYD